MAPSITPTAPVQAAHDVWRQHATGPGTWWTGEQRRAFVLDVWAAIEDADPLPPWVSPAAAGRATHSAPALAEVAYRLGRHAATATEAWYRGVLDKLDVEAPAYVELVALAAMGAAVATVPRALDLDRPELAPPAGGEPARVAPELVPAALNWVPVTPPADTRAAVVQAFSAVPAEMKMLWRMGGAQYMPLDEMVQMDWRRGALHRSQIELVAARTSLLRQCFF